jgi:ATP-dependent DNA helicase RecG
VACLAPTEILASQLFQKFKAWFEPFGFECFFLSGKITNKASILKSIRENRTSLVVGTHALFQESVQFNHLGLVMIDEQHRFGVNQRLSLFAKSDKPVYQLVMTATPIPRTLALAQYGHLSVSTIKELPMGRQPIKTVMMSQSRRLEVIQKMRDLCLLGQQIYWLCTVIDESESCQTAQISFNLLQSECVGLKIGLIHGRLSTDEKQNVMDAFRQGEIQILVATTVIEVGVDVPNATLMVVENPERLGLAQLHQLRGRVGRGSLQSFCILLYKQPLSETAKERLMVLRDSQDGFLIAEKDLELRGAGDLVGQQQSGIANFKIADWVRDKELILKLAGDLSGMGQQEQVELCERWIGSDPLAHSP